VSTTVTSLLLLLLIAMLGCAKTEPKSSETSGTSTSETQAPPPSMNEGAQPSSTNEWAESDSVAGIAIHCPPNVFQTRLIPINGKTGPPPCVHMPPGAHVCFHDTAVWNSNADFPVTITFTNGSPFKDTSFTVPANGEKRLDVVNRGTFPYTTNPAECISPHVPPEVIVDN